VAIDFFRLPYYGSAAMITRFSPFGIRSDSNAPWNEIIVSPNLSSAEYAQVRFQSLQPRRTLVDLGIGM